VGTGNFNEKTSRIYTDLSLLTADREIGAEIRKVFQLFENNLGRPMFRRLLVSPFNTRRKLNALIDQEINAAKKGKEAKIQIKLNNLTDEKLIQKLITASQHGVQIEMIIRGICCLIPGLKKISDNIKVISIVDRYLEHGRFFIFHNQGNPQYYLTSADFMERNLDKRIEVGVQLIDPNVQKEIQLIFDYQWKGSVKARAITKDLKNRYTHRDLPTFHAQKELYHYYVEKSGRVDVD
jgi:polyphosphate kinase